MPPPQQPAAGQSGAPGPSSRAGQAVLRQPGGGASSAPTAGPPKPPNPTKLQFEYYQMFGQWPNFELQK